ncbi:MAG: hypothetical protein ACRENK_02860 [Gemmatimonadaceae bacterium]
MRHALVDKVSFITRMAWWLDELSTYPRLVAVSALVVMIGGCMGYVPGQQSYWDAKVKEMCEKDGGVTIYHQIRISRAEIDRHVLPVTADGKLGVALKELAQPDAPVYAVRKTTYLHESNPQVGRVEWTAIRRSDGAAVARWITYGRSGGDFPSPAHASNFTCPNPEKIISDLQKLFAVEREVK